jgi:hypothetical protein
MVEKGEILPQQQETLSAIFNKIKVNDNTKENGQIAMLDQS